jgi:hypothetical protein
MDELLKSVLPGLGAFGPFAVLAWWIINNQAKQLEARDTYISALTKDVIEVNKEASKTMAELRARIEGQN